VSLVGTRPSDGVPGARSSRCPEKVQLGLAGGYCGRDVAEAVAPLWQQRAGLELDFCFFFIVFLASFSNQLAVDGESIGSTRGCVVGERCSAAAGLSPLPVARENTALLAKWRGPASGTKTFQVPAEFRADSARPISILGSGNALGR